MQLTMLLLLAWLAYTVAELTWSVIDSPKQVAESRPLLLVNEDSSSTFISHAQLVQAVIKQHPFGQVKTQTAVVQPKQEIKAPETKLNYKLRGLYYSTNKTLASAIIETPNNVDSYLIDEEVEDGISIYDIKVDHIVLERYGKHEVLSLDESSFNKNGASINVSKQPSDERKHNALLKNYRKRFIKNPMVLAKKFRAIPVTKNGRNVGFKLKALRGEALLKKLNIHEDAVFTSINGVALNQPFKAIEALKSLQTAKQITVTYQLNGAEQSRLFEL